MLGQRCRRWANIKSTLCQRLAYLLLHSHVHNVSLATTLTKRRRGTKPKVQIKKYTTLSRIKIWKIKFYFETAQSTAELLGLVATRKAASYPGNQFSEF